MVLVDPKLTPNNKSVMYGKLKVRSRPPVTLHLNFEARKETLRHYVPFFKDKVGESVAYFNPTLDVLFLSFFWDFWPDHPHTMAVVEQLCPILAVARRIVFTGNVLDCEELRYRASCPEYKRFFPELRTIDHFERVAYSPGNEDVHQHDQTVMWFRSCCGDGCNVPKAPPNAFSPLGGEEVECEQDPWRLHLLKDCGDNGAPNLKTLLSSCEQVVAGKSPDDILKAAKARVLLGRQARREGDGAL